MGLNQVHVLGVGCAAQMLSVGSLGLRGSLEATVGVCVMGGGGLGGLSPPGDASRLTRYNNVEALNQPSSLRL